LINTNEFERLAEEQLRPLYSYCLSLMCDPHCAEELAQEVLVRAFQSWPTLKDHSKFAPWLRGIARRCSWNLWRSAKRNPLDRRENADDGELLNSIEAEQDTPADQMQKNELKQSLLKALKKLSRRNREVVILRYFEELSYAEIALRLGITVDVVDQRLTRSKLKLRGMLQSVEI
jgi:RNA polymerase sigma-70 factor, ECF subfamily